VLQQLGLDQPAPGREPVREPVQQDQRAPDEREVLRILRRLVSPRISKKPASVSLSPNGLRPVWRCWGAGPWVLSTGVSLGRLLRSHRQGSGLVALLSAVDGGARDTE
jgi:hypothetical protein